MVILQLSPLGLPPARELVVFVLADRIVSIQCDNVTIQYWPGFRKCGNRSPCAHRHCNDCFYELLSIHGTATVTNGPPKQTICAFVGWMIKRAGLAIMDYIQPGWPERHGYPPETTGNSNTTRQRSNNTNAQQHGNSTCHQDGHPVYTGQNGIPNEQSHIATRQNRKARDEFHKNPPNNAFTSHIDTELRDLADYKNDLAEAEEGRSSVTRVPPDYDLASPEPAHIQENTTIQQTQSHGTSVPHQGVTQGNVLSERNVHMIDQQGVMKFKPPTSHHAH